MFRRPPTLALFVVLLMGAAAINGCHTEEGHAIELPAIDASSTRAIDLGSARVTQVNTSEAIVASGTVEPARIVVVGSPLMARVDAVNVDEGDIVDEGDVLIRLDTTSGRLQVAQAQANLASTRVQLDRAAADIERYTPLAASGVVSQQQVDTLGSQRDGLRESIEAGEAMVSLARSQVNDGTVRAPFRATVTELPVDVGAMASPGGALVRLVDMSSVDVRIRLAESEMREIQLNQELLVRAPGLGVERTGTVRFIDPELDSSDRTGEVLVRVDNADSAWLAGAFAEVTLPRRNETNALVLPRDAILRTGAGTFALIPDADGYRRQPVQVTALPDGQWRVDGGLSLGDEVATGALADARIVNTAAAAPSHGGAQEDFQ